MRIPCCSWPSMKCSSNTRTSVSRACGCKVYWRSSRIGQQCSMGRFCQSRGTSERATLARSRGATCRTPDWYHRSLQQAAPHMATSRQAAPHMATSRRSPNLLIRLDPRRRGGMQQQICASIERAILDGVVAPGTRLASSRALADDLGVSRTTTLLAVQQLQAEGYLTARRGSGTFVADELPDDLLRRRSAPSPRSLRHPPLSRRGAALVAAEQGAERLGGPPRAFRIGTPGVDLFPVALWWRLVSRRLRSITAAQLDYGDPAGLRALREAIAEHVQTARGTRCAADQILVVSGAQQGLELICRLLLDPG